ncbi:MAG: tol-pal system protein YbgF [Cytophagaceae bacterium]
MEHSITLSWLEEQSKLNYNKNSSITLNFVLFLTKISPMPKSILTIILILGSAISPLFAQNESKEMLLMDESIQIEATDAVNQLYNFKFDSAEAKFREFRVRYPEHPMPHFLMGLSTWWKILPNTDVTKHDETFLAYMDSSLTLAEKLYEEDKKNYEAIFFLAAAHGFKAELHGYRKNYRKATFSGSKALSFLQDISENDLSPEFLYGNAILNYYSQWIKEEYPLLKPILVFFPKGDKELGISQLKEVASFAFYTRTEAQYQLMKIHYLEDKYKEGMPTARYLATTFPDNGYFERYYALFAFKTGHMIECEYASKNVLTKLEAGMPGYDEIGGRYAGFFLGYINQHLYNNKEKAKEYYKKAVYYAEKIDATKQGYYLYSLSALAKFAHDEGDHLTAHKYYKTIKKNTGKSYKDSEMYREAKKNSKNRYKKQWED